MSERLRNAYRGWRDAAPGKEASLAFHALVRAAMAGGYLLPEATRVQNADAHSVLLWVWSRLGIPPYPNGSENPQ